MITSLPHPESVSSSNGEGVYDENFDFDGVGTEEEAKGFEQLVVNSGRNDDEVEIGSVGREFRKSDVEVVDGCEL